LFRFFDITKIPPARFFDQKMKNGYGVVLDDVVAGIYACLSLHLLLRFL
jgi:phosphatidylglycerophosphatase A